MAMCRIYFLMVCCLTVHFSQCSNVEKISPKCVALSIPLFASSPSCHHVSTAVEAFVRIFNKQQNNTNISYGVTEFIDGEFLHENYLNKDGYNITATLAPITHCVQKFAEWRMRSRDKCEYDDTERITSNFKVVYDRGNMSWAVIDTNEWQALRNDFSDGFPILPMPGIRMPPTRMDQFKVKMSSMFVVAAMIGIIVTLIGAKMLILRNRPKRRHFARIKNRVQHENRSSKAYSPAKTKTREESASLLLTGNRFAV